jgi:hypothetical protein
MTGAGLAYLRFHRGEVYEIGTDADGRYTATDRYRDHQQLTADTTDGLLRLIRRHYPGTRADLSST